MTETITQPGATTGSHPCPEWCTTDHTRDSGQLTVETPDDVLVHDGPVLRLDDKVEVFPVISFSRAGIELERLVSVRVPERDLTMDEVRGLEAIIDEARSMLEPTEKQEKDDDSYIAKMIERHRAAAAGFGEAEWAALGKRLLRDQLSAPDGGNMYVNTSDYIADLSGIPLLRLWGIDEEDKTLEDQR